MYQFEWRVPAFNGTYGATHGAEVPFIFGNVAAASGFHARPEQYRLLEKRMVAAWSAFAHSGNPNNAYLPEWPPYSAASRGTMCFGRAGTDSNDCSIEYDPGSAGRLAMQAINAHRSGDTRSL
jgi:para-nitrobenzyl esterase